MSSVVIIGGGIIGLATALSISGLPSRPAITIVDNAPALLLGASGAANGGTSGKLNQNPVGRLNYRLRKALEADVGTERWCSRLNLTVEVGDTGEETPRWVRGVDGLAKPISREFEHIYPKLFCEYLLEQCLERGVVIKTATTATGIRTAGNHIEAIITAPNNDLADESVLACTHLVLAAGCWTPALMRNLFPHARLDIQLREHVNQLHWLNVRDDGWERNGKRVTQVLFENVLGMPLNMTDYDNGLVYVGTTELAVAKAWVTTSQDEGDEELAQKADDGDVALPKSIADVVVDEAKIQEMTRLAAKVLGQESVQVVRCGRAFYGGLTCQRPITARLTAAMLGWDENPTADTGVFVSCGHDSAMSEALAHGLVVAEMIDGRREEELSLRLEDFAVPKEYVRR